ncbi:MAG: AraC family transcriptional regulator [Bacteroidales bacterium]|nr:AraC family transcriptional regulator [Bacteroidales bacterium]
MKKISFVRQLAMNITKTKGKKKIAATAGSRSGAVDTRTRQIMAKWLADKGWAENLNLDEISEKLGLSKQKLALYAYCLYRMSFLRWRRELRIEEAKRLLLEDKKAPTALIGEYVGISDKSNFRRQFKEATGYTPAEWRRLKH